MRFDCWPQMQVRAAHVECNSSTSTRSAKHLAISVGEGGGLGSRARAEQFSGYIHARIHTLSGGLASPHAMVCFESHFGEHEERSDAN